MICKVINSSKGSLEEDVNTWLNTGRYEILHIVQTTSDNGYNITLTILYYDIREERKKKLENITKSKNE